MANCAFMWHILSDSATLSLGSWLSALPIANAQTSPLAQVARSTDATLASTKFLISFSAPVAIDALVLSNHNLQKDALIKLTGSASPSLTSPSTQGWLPAWPYQWDTGVLPAGHPNYSTRLLTNAQIAALNPKRDAIQILPSQGTYQYWMVEIDDTTNTDGHIDIGRLALGWLYRPTVNLAVGSTTGHADFTLKTVGPSGTRFYGPSTKGRHKSALFPVQQVGEAIGVIRDMAEEVGVDRQFYWIFDSSDAYNLQRTSYLVNLTDMPTFEYIGGGLVALQLNMQEVLP